LVEAGRLEHDPAQEHIARLLDRCRDQLIDEHHRPWWKRGRAREAVPGLYVFGGVGRGKTLLMNLLATSLESTDVAAERIHFHRFMDRVHRQLKQREGERDPLRAIAAEIAGRVKVLCFDEFHVSDIGDAMLLGELLQTLFARGVILVATSNTAPDELYANGLQRDRFLPAIEAIKAHCRVVALKAAEDFRLRELARHPTWLSPQTDAQLTELAAEFKALATGERVQTEPLRIRGRDVASKRHAGSVVWFDFDTLCRGHRSSTDYIELSKRFSTVIIQDVPALGEIDNDAARRFVHLVDECYDRAVKLIVAAAVPIEQLYSGQRLASPFERTVSRLIEMQSLDYLGLPHRP
jgi:cell division protein ZapE